MNDFDNFLYFTTPVFLIFLDCLYCVVKTVESARQTTVILINVKYLSVLNDQIRANVLNFSSLIGFKSKVVYILLFTTSNKMYW